MTPKFTAASETIKRYDTQCMWPCKNGNTQHNCMSSMLISLLLVDMLSSPPVLSAPEYMHSIHPSLDIGEMLHSVPNDTPYTGSLLAKNCWFCRLHMNLRQDDLARSRQSLEMTFWTSGSY